jgi:hypothetical protein
MDYNSKGARGYVADGGKQALGPTATYTPKVVEGVDNRPPVGGHKYSDYELPVCRVDEEDRSFPGVHCLTSGDSAFMNAVSEEGTTETRGRYGINKSHKDAAGRSNRNFGKPMQYEGEMYNG